MPADSYFDVTCFSAAQVNASWPDMNVRQLIGWYVVPLRFQAFYSGLCLLGPKSHVNISGPGILQTIVDCS